MSHRPQDYAFPYFAPGTTVVVLDNDDDNGRVGTIEELEYPTYGGNLPYLVRFSEGTSWVSRVKAFAANTKVQIPIDRLSEVLPDLGLANHLRLIKLLDEFGVEVTL